MRIIESLCQGKRSASICEDGYVVTHHFATVADGSTSKWNRPPHGEPTTGQVAMQAVLRATMLLRPQCTHDEAARYMARAIREVTPQWQQLPPSRRPTCSAVVFSKFRHELWLFGDCQCRMNGRTYTHPKLIDSVLTQIRCDVARHLLSHGHTPQELRKNDLSRAFILDALREQTHFQNDTNRHNPFRYTVIDGSPLQPDDVVCLPVPQGTRRIILASDGYPELFDTLQATEAHLQELLQADPLCINENPATKCLMEGQCSFDDRTYLCIDPF